MNKTGINKIKQPKGKYFFKPPVKNKRNVQSGTNKYAKVT